MRETPPGVRTIGRGGRRPPEAAIVLGVGLAVAAIATVPFLLNRAFYYGGDNPQSFVPLWHHFGEQLRSGRWPPLDPAGWTGGNYAAEGTYALWNPVQLADYVLVSLFDDLATAAALVQIQFLALLGAGAYLLFREYGAGRPAAVVVACAVPFAGFTLYYEANGWPAGLMAFTWVTWFWWAARRQSRGHLLPVVTFALGALAMTTGNPYAALGMVVVLTGIAAELAVRRAWRALGGLVLTGACVGATAALVFWPLVATLPVTDRQETAMLANDTFLVPQLGDLLTSSAPTYLPAILNFGGALLERSPSTYAIWFALPLLPWVRWRGLRRPDRPLISVATIAAVFAVLTLGPSNLWLFRWPIRLVEYLYLALAVLLALLLSRGPATDAVRRRTVATVAVVLAGGYLSFAVRPDLVGAHLLATAGVLALVALALQAHRRRGRAAWSAALVCGTVLVVGYQAALLPVREPGAADLAQLPSSIAQVREASSSYRGTVLQLADPETLRTAPRRYTGHLLFGNETLMSGRESIVRYSGMGFGAFAEALCMGYRGQVCPEALDRALRPVEGTGVPLVDLLRVQTLVLDARLFAGAAAGSPPPGWSAAVRDGLRTVWVREPVAGYGGRLSWASPGVRVLADRSTATRESVTLDTATGGSLVFARLAWPGYGATLDGEPLEVREGPAGLLAVDVPAGRHLLELRFASPGRSVGVAAVAVAALLVLGQSAAWFTGGRRPGRRAGALPTGGPPGPAGAGAGGAPRGESRPMSGTGRRPDGGLHAGGEVPGPPASRPAPAVASRALPGALLAWGRRALVAAVIGFAVLQVVREWDAVSATLRSLPWPHLLLALAAVSAGVLVSPLVWRAALAAMGVRIGVPDAARIYLVGQLGKYVPGSVVAIVLQMELARAAGVSRARGLTASLLTAGVAVVTSLVAGLLAVPALAGNRPVLLWLFALLPVGLALLHPAPLTRLVDRVLALLRQGPLPRRLAGAAITRAAGLSLGVYLLYGVHLFVLVDAVLDPAPTGRALLLVLCVGTMGVAMTAGLVAFVLPSGIGARELVVVGALAAVLSYGPALALAVVSRVLFTVVELVCAGAATLAARLAARAAASG